VFSKLPRAKGKKDIFGGHKNVQKRGSKMDIFDLSTILNEIFSAEKSPLFYFLKL